MGATLVVALVILFFALGYTGREPGTARLAFTPHQNVDIPTPPPVLVDVTTRELMAAYDAEGASVYEKLHGKHLRVTGVVHTIEQDFAGGTLVALHTTNKLMPAHMSIEAGSQAATRSLRTGQKVVLVCTHMEHIMSLPYGSECRLQP
jgi:hypothetical protein